MWRNCALLMIILGYSTTLANDGIGIMPIGPDHEQLCGDQGKPLTNSDGTSVFCSQDVHDCPTGYLCNRRQDRYAVCCPSDICQMKVDPGPCRADIEKWYHDSTEHTCRLYSYGGCLGNDNRFDTKVVCERACRKQCCPPHQYLICARDDMCDLDTDCPRDTICCPSICKDIDVCHRPVPCCCPGGAVSNGTDHLQCRGDYDCPSVREKCCASGHTDDHQLYCRAAIPCPCKAGPLCCPRLGVTSPGNPLCQWCTQDSVCGPTEKCCPDEKGCSRCAQAQLCRDV